MKRTITINGNEGRWDTPLFVLTDNDSLVIDIALPTITNGIYRFIATHGSQKKHVTLGHKSIVELSADWLKAGGEEPLCSQLQVYDKTGTVVYRSYDIEPLKIRVCECGTEYFAAVQAVEKENAKLRKELGEVKADIAEVKRDLSAIPEKIKEAQRLAVVEATGGDVMNA